MDKAEIEAIRPARMPEITVGKLGALAAPGVRLSVQHGGRVKTFSPSEAHGGLRGRTIRRLSGMKAAMAEPVLYSAGPTRSRWKLSCT